MSWFRRRAKAPVTEEYRNWIESGLLLLSDELGVDILRQPPVRIHESFFPDYFKGGDQQVAGFVRSICARIEVDAASIELKMVDQLPKSPIAWPRLEVSDSGPALILDRRGFKDKKLLIGHLLLELLKLKFSKAGGWQPPHDARELLTELVAVYYGFGIFMCHVASTNAADRGGARRAFPPLNEAKDLPLSAVIFAFAVYCVIANRDPLRLKAHMSEANLKALVKACAWLEKNGIEAEGLVYVRKSLGR